MRPLPSGDTSLTAFLDRAAHAYTRRELIHTWSRRQLDRALAHGAIVRLVPGVYAAATHADNPVVRGEALNLWQPTGAVTGPLALHLYAPTLPQPQFADLVLPHGHHVGGEPWMRLHQTRPVRGLIAAQGVMCVEMPRALLDAWRLAAPVDQRDLLYEALWARVCTWRALVNELERTPRVAGRAELQRLLRWFAAGATSPLEVRAKHETFTGVRFRDLEWQAELQLRSRRVTVDILHRPSMVVVELDGDRYHSTRRAREADRERQTELAAAGYIVLRFGWRDIADRPVWCRDRLQAAIASDRRRLPSA